jgi:hypothetical protein
MSSTSFCTRASLSRRVAAIAVLSLVMHAFHSRTYAADTISEAIASARASQARIQMSNNMREILIALCNYEVANGSYPPAIIYGPDGKPWHSWRILIAPYLDGGIEAARDYDFSQPWDSKANLKAASKGIPAFHNPIGKDAKPGLAGYALLVSNAGMFDPAGMRMQSADDKSVLRGAGKKLSDCLDGTSNTFCLVPVVPEKRVFWTEPADVSVDDAKSAAAAGVLFFPQETADETAYSYAGRCDGAVISFPATLDPKLLRAMTSRRGFEVYDQDSWVLREP